VGITTGRGLTANVLLENLACKAGAVHALRDLLARTGADPLGIGFVLSSGEEAIGDRYQRGGGNLAKAVAEDCGLENASGSDVKAFCAGPILALIQAAALVASGVHERVAVVAGGSLAKLGMKFRGALERETPILEDVLAAMAVLVGPAEDAPAGSPVMRLDAVGRHRIGSGSSQQALLEDIVGRRSLRWDDGSATSTASPRAAQPRVTDPPGRDVPSATTACSPGSRYSAASSGEMTSRPGRGRTVCRGTRRRRVTSRRRSRGCRTRSPASERGRSGRRCCSRRGACSSAA
jgi:betaine reductase